jgi:hypothetical protein
MNKDTIGSIISGIILILLGISCTWQICSVTEKAVYLSIMGIEITPTIIGVSGPFYDYSTVRDVRGARYNEHYNTIIKYLNQDGVLRTSTILNSKDIRIVYSEKYPKLFMNSSHGRGFFTLIFQRYNYLDVIPFIFVASFSSYAGCFLLVQLLGKYILDEKANAS